MANQDNQNPINADTTALKTYEKSKLAFVGCENCSSINCCDGSKFNRASVLLNDLYDLAKFFPAVFMPTDKGDTIKMELIFSLKKGVPCFYLDSGSQKCTVWNSARPRVCTSYPLLKKINTVEGSRASYTIGIDGLCEGVRESSEGIQIFTDEGEISEEIIDRFFGREVLAEHEKNLQATNTFLELVKELDLLAWAEIVYGKEPLPDGGHKDAVFKFLMINEEKLAALDADTVKRLQGAGYIDVINTHRKSLFLFKKLIQAVKALEKPTQSNNL